MSDEERFGAVYDAHRDAAYAYALRRVGVDTAADVVAEVFLVAWRRRGELPVRPLPWLYRVARKTVANQCRSADRYLRLAARIRERAPVPGVAAAGGVEAAVVTSRTIAAAFARLSADERELLGLVAWEGLTARDAATVSGCGCFRCAVNTFRRLRQSRT